MRLYDFFDASWTDLMFLGCALGTGLFSLGKAYLQDRSILSTRETLSAGLNGLYLGVGALLLASVFSSEALETLVRSNRVMLGMAGFALVVHAISELPERINRKKPDA